MDLLDQPQRIDVTAPIPDYPPMLFLHQGTRHQIKKADGPERIRKTLAGIVRAHTAAQAAGMQLIIGCRLELLDGPPMLAYPTDKAAYGRLSALLTTGNLRAEKGHCHLYKKDVYQHSQGLLFISLPPDTLNAYFDFDNTYKGHLADYRNHFGPSLYLSVSRSYEGADTKRIFRLRQLSEQFDIPLVATNDVHYHIPERSEL